MRNESNHKNQKPGDKAKHSSMNQHYMNEPIFNKESVEQSLILKIIVEVFILVAIYFFLKVIKGEVTWFSYISFVAGYFLIGVIRRFMIKRRSGN